MAKKKYVAKAPIRRLMKREGANLVAEDAVELLIKQLEKEAKAVTKSAIKIVKGDKRKRLMKEDVLEAVRSA